MLWRVSGIPFGKFDLSREEVQVDPALSNSVWNLDLPVLHILASDSGLVFWSFVGQIPVHVYRQRPESFWLKDHEGKGFTKLGLGMDGT